MKKRIYILSVLFSTGLNVVLAQNHATVKLDNGSKLLRSVSVNNGLVLFTGSESILSKNLNWKISYYSPHLTTRYQAPVTDAGIKEVPGSFLVVSPSGNNVYFIRHGEGGLSGSENTQNIMLIDTAGLSSSFKMKDELEYDRVNAVFADDNYLYYVTKEKDNTTKNKHAFPKLQFVRIAHDKSVSKIMLALPNPDPDATEWSYLGHTKVVSYFVSRTLNDENYKEEKYRIAVIDHDGKLQDDFKIDFNLVNGKLLPGFNYGGSEGSYVVNNHNIKVKAGNSTGTPTTTTPDSYSPFPEAYGNIILDPETNGFYVYGMSGTAPANKKGDEKAKKEEDPDPTGYYVYKYDQDGKEVWTNEGKLAGIDDYFKSKAGFSSRQIALRYGVGGNLRFQAFAMKNVATMEINPQTGKFVAAYSNAFENVVKETDLQSCHKAGEKSDLSQFLSKPDKGDYNQLSFRMLNSNIVIRDFYKDSRLEMYDFGD